MGINRDLFWIRRYETHPTSGRNEYVIAVTSFHLSEHFFKQCLINLALLSVLYVFTGNNSITALNKRTLR
jgi:hypothetical protein